MLFIEGRGGIVNKKFFYCLLVIGLVVPGILVAGCEKEEEAAVRVEEPPKEEPPKIEQVIPLRNAIEIKAEGEVLHYQRASFWNDEDFSKLLESKEEFEAKEIDSFQRTVGEYNKYAVSPRMEFDESERLTALFGDIKGAKEQSWFDFDWFLRPCGLDFMDSHFERKEKELYREGEVEGTNTTVSIKFPYSISNCHEHVWRKK